MVEAVRAGYIFARDAKQYRRWSHRSRPGKRGGGLSGMALERVVMGLARAHPEYVVMGA